MKVAPRLLPAMMAALAALGATGCRTAGTGSIAHNRPPVVRPQTLSFDLQEFVAEHNDNAERIRSVEAKPAITATMGPKAEAQSGGANGLLAIERPRNFKLELAHSMATIADIGSNDERFWFWLKNSKDRSVYYCDYSELSSTSLAVTYQPDWIVEAMGLKEITPDEAAQIKVRPGPVTGTTILTFAPVSAGGATYTRELVISERTRAVNEFRVLASDGKTPIAQATIATYRRFPLGGSPQEGTGKTQETCSLPEHLVLEWKRELLVLDVSLRNVRINQFDTSKRAARFVQPTVMGYTPVNLAELARQKPSGSSTAVRQTLPAPERQSRGRANPAALEIRGEDAAALKPRPRREPAGPKSPLLQIPDLEVVEAPLPKAPGSSDFATGTALMTGPGGSLER